MRQNFLQSSGQSEKEINVILSTNLIKKYKKYLSIFLLLFDLIYNCVHSDIHTFELL